MTSLQTKIGILSRSNGDTTLEMPTTNGNQKLSILVENQGRINNLKFLKDRKVNLNYLNIMHVKNIWFLGDFVECDTWKSYPRSVDHDWVSTE